MIRFSVVICTYNYARFLPFVFRCLAAQTLRDFEVVVLDDGSTDETPSVVRQGHNCCETLVYVRQPNAGLAAARNAAISHASGEYVALLDADDLWSPEYLSSVQEALKRHPGADLLISNGLVVRNDGTVLGPMLTRSALAQCGPTKSGTTVADVVYGAFPSATTFRKELFHRAGPYRDGLGGAEDGDWLIRALHAGAYFVPLHDKLVLYRRHPKAMAAAHDRFFLNWLEVYRATLLPNYPDRETHATTRRYVQRWIISLAARHRGARTRELIGIAGGVVGWPPSLVAAYVASYFGANHVARLALDLRNRVRNRRMPKLEMAAAPADLFEYVEGTYGRSNRGVASPSCEPEGGARGT